MDESYTINIHVVIGTQPKGPRYTNKKKLLKAKTTADLWGNNKQLLNNKDD